MSLDFDAWAVVRLASPDGEVVIRPDRAIGVSRGWFPDEAGRTVHIVTAHNPGGLTASPAENSTAHARLLASAHEAGLSVWAAARGDRDWIHTEPGLGLVGLTDDEARALGARFGQETILAWRPDAWLLLSCETSVARMTGWVTQPLSAPSAPEAGHDDAGDDDAGDEPDAGDTDTDDEADFDDLDRSAPPYLVMNDGWPDDLDVDSLDPDSDGSDIVVLADVYWDLGPGGGGSPGNDDSGRVVLVRDGRKYFTVQIGGGERIVDEHPADGDDDAIESFRAGSNNGERIAVYSRNLR